MCVEHRERFIDRLHQKSPLFWQTTHNGESKWTNGMARRLPLPLALALPNSPNTTAGLEAAAAAKFLPLLRIYYIYREREHTNESGFQIKPILPVYTYKKKLELDSFFSKSVRVSCVCMTMYVADTICLQMTAFGK